MKCYKARIIMTGKEYKKFIKGIEDVDDDRKYMLIFHAESIRDYFRFYWSVLRKHKATFTRQ